MRRIGALLTIFTLWLAFPAVAGGPNHVVNVSPAADGSQIVRAGVQVTSTAADSITSTNLALARPTGCTGCEGVAAAYQAVIMTGNPSEFAPKNAAVAVNSECTNCKAFAYAYQYTVSADRGTRLSSTGRSKITAIRAKAAELVSAGLEYLELETRLAALAAEFKAAVVADLVRTDADPHGGTPDADIDEAPLEG